MVKIFIYWFIYSFFGWITETLYTSIPKKSFQDRGFLAMPIIPIYGFGAIIAVYVLKSVSDHMVLVFILGLILTSLLEYITSLMMEKLFHMRWWDYSHRKFNVQGRVCLRNSLLFGLLSVFLVKWIHPLMMNLLEPVDTRILQNIAVVLMITLFFDGLHSLLFSLKFSRVFLDLDKKSYISAREDVLEHLEKLNTKILKLEHHLIRKYPVLKQDLLDKLEEIRSYLEK